MTLSIDIQHNSIECHYAECRYAECSNAECHYAECHSAKCRYAECHGALLLKKLTLIFMSFFPEKILNLHGDFL